MARKMLSGLCVVSLFMSSTLSMARVNSSKEEKPLEINRVSKKAERRAKYEEQKERAIRLVTADARSKAMGYFARLGLYGITLWGVQAGLKKVRTEQDREKAMRDKPGAKKENINPIKAQSFEQFYNASLNYIEDFDPFNPFLLAIPLALKTEVIKSFTGNFKALQNRKDSAEPKVILSLIKIRFEDMVSSDTLPENVKSIVAGEITKMSEFLGSKVENSEKYSRTVQFDKWFEIIEDIYLPSDEETEVSTNLPFFNELRANLKPLNTDSKNILFLEVASPFTRKNLAKAVAIDLSLTFVEIDINAGQSKADIFGKNLKDPKFFDSKLSSLSEALAKAGSGNGINNKKLIYIDGDYETLKNSPALLELIEKKSESVRLNDIGIDYDLRGSIIVIGSGFVNSEDQIIRSTVQNYFQVI